MSERIAQSQSLAVRVLAMCKRRNWSLHWTARGAYLHLESSELIESVRGKGTSTPTEEAGDVLMVLMSITENEGIPWSDVVAAMEAKLERLESSPPYQGESRMDGQSASKPIEFSDSSARLHYMLHRLWSSCVDKPGYDKQAWREIERQLYAAGVIR